jgi:2-oxoglutarate ferredoxin oxidoreductase subunit delta
MKPVEIEHERCKGCGLCVEFCPQHCISMSDGLNDIGYHPAEFHHAEKCSSCALCATMCPEGGIKVFRRRRKSRG